MKNKKIIIISLCFILLLNIVNAENKLTITDLYKTDETWCSNLNILVSGQDINSNDYYLIDCGESMTPNLWYCNCEVDEDFEVSFVNSINDFKTYIVDIRSGSTSVRRIVSKNKLIDEETKTLQNQTFINEIDLKFSNLDNKIIFVSNRLDEIYNKDYGIDNVNTRIGNIEKIIDDNNIIIDIDNDYTEIYNKIDLVDNKINDLPNTRSILFVLFTMVMIIIVWLVIISNELRKIKK